MESKGPRSAKAVFRVINRGDHPTYQNKLTKRHVKMHMGYKTENVGCVQITEAL